MAAGGAFDGIIMGPVLVYGLVGGGIWLVAAAAAAKGSHVSVPELTLVIRHGAGCQSPVISRDFVNLALSSSI